MSNRRRALYDLLRRQLVAAYLRGDDATHEHCCRTLARMCDADAAAQGKIQHGTMRFTKETSPRIRLGGRKVGSRNRPRHARV